MDNNEKVGGFYFSCELRIFLTPDGSQLVTGGVCRCV